MKKVEDKDHTQLGGYEKETSLHEGMRQGDCRPQRRGSRLSRLPAGALAMVAPTESTK